MAQANLRAKRIVPLMRTALASRPSLCGSAIATARCRATRAAWSRNSFAKRSPGRRWEIYGDGEQTRDFIFVEDVAEAIVLAATAQAVAGEVFQIASNAGNDSARACSQNSPGVFKAHGINPPAIRLLDPASWRYEAKLLRYAQSAQPPWLEPARFARRWSRSDGRVVSLRAGKSS